MNPLLDSFALFYTFFIVNKCVNFCQDKTFCKPADCQMVTKLYFSLAWRRL